MKLRVIKDRNEALRLGQRLDRCADEVTREFRDAALPEGVGRRLIERSFDASESIFLVAEESEANGEVRGLCSEFLYPRRGGIGALARARSSPPAARSCWRRRTLRARRPARSKGQTAISPIR